ncbi:hypothetical protein NFI96_013613, partial [Prochilodus magdalenae]
MGKHKTKNQKTARVASQRVAEEEYGTVPHSFVFHRGLVGKNVDQLVTDMRRVMEPYTAKSLKVGKTPVRKKNVLKDFVTAAGPLGVTHFLVFTKTQTSVNLRLARLPKGPSLYFQVTKYSLIKDVISSLKRHRMHGQQFTHHPLLVLNNFGLDGMHIKLMATMFQNMFPSINVHKVSLNSIKRCVLVSYDPESQEIEFRHYSLKVVPVGMSKGVKKIMQERVPNMSKLEDISELLLKGANLSESEAEQDGDHNITELPQIYSGRGNMRSQQSAVRLTEIGPRMTLRLVKIVEGMGDGNVLYHSILTKTEEELQEILKRKETRLKEKAERRKKQEQNIALKKEKRDENKKKSLEGIKKKRQQEEAGSDDSEVEDPGMQEGQAVAEESEDEAEYYRQAVGQEPDEEEEELIEFAFDALEEYNPLLVTLPGFLGNIVALWMLVTKERKNWHTGVVFSCNLAISDILYVLTFPLIIISWKKTWIFTPPVCKIERFLFACNLYVSIYFIMCISVNRYLAIVHPFFTRKHVGPKHAKIASVLVWVTVAILSSPILRFADVENSRCRSFSENSKEYKYIYRIFMAVMGCLVPFVVTFASYFGVMWAVLKSANITALEKKKVSLIVASVCIIYAMSFVPYHILQVWHFYLKEN